MLLLLARLALADSTEPAPAAEAAPDVPVERTPAGRTYSNVVHVEPQVVRVSGTPFTPEQQVANVPGVVMDRFRVIREIRGAAPVLYVDGMRVMGTGPRR